MQTLLQWLGVGFFIGCITISIYRGRRRWLVLIIMTVMGPLALAGAVGMIIFFLARGIIRKRRESREKLKQLNREELEAHYRTEKEIRSRRAVLIPVISAGLIVVAFIAYAFATGQPVIGMFRGLLYKVQYYISGILS